MKAQDGDGGGEEGGERREDHDEDEPRAMGEEKTAGAHEDGAVVYGDDGDAGGVVRFPTVLHSLLTGGRGVADGERAADRDDNDGGGRRGRAIASAVEWLPHGKGFRVLRWDELCRRVLPIEFPALCDPFGSGTTRTLIDRDEEGGDGKDATTAAGAKKMNRNDGMGDGADRSPGEERRGGYSDEQWIDSFLWHVRAWGFQEVTAGIDKGSFRHEVRFDYVLAFLSTIEMAHEILFSLTTSIS